MSSMLHKRFRVHVPHADIHEQPRRGKTVGNAESQLLLGEDFIARYLDGDFVYGQSPHDNYEGYVPLESLKTVQGSDVLTHFCDSASTLVYPQPDIRSRPKEKIGFMSRLAVCEHSLKDGFVLAAGLGWLPHDHLKPLEALNEKENFVDTALRLKGTPYRYGGRNSAMGIDCSALVQLALARGGVRSMRDAWQQEDDPALGAYVDPQAPRRRGDVVFFKGHVGIMVDDVKIINATTTTMRVETESLDLVAARNGGIKAVRRPYP